MPSDSKRRLRSENWFNDPEEACNTAIYVERFLNYGLTREEIQSGRPIIGLAQIGSDITPCNRVHLETIERAREGVRDTGGLPFVFPVHPLQESCRRPTAALDRNLAYLGLVEILHGYPFDGIVLTAGCDKTTPAGLMAAATANLPTIVLSGGPMLDSYFEGKLAGSGVVIWEGRRRLAAGEIDYEGFMEMAAASAPSPGHCNTMGTALTMNCLAEVLGMTLPGCASIPAAYRERLQMAYATGRRIVEMVHEDLTPEKVMVREAFENAIVANTAFGGSTNAPPHLAAVARHMGVELAIEDWQTIGHPIPLLVNCQPAGEYLGEGFHRAGGVPAVLRELLDNGLIHGDVATVTGATVSCNVADAQIADPDVIRSVAEPLRETAGFLVLKGNLFDSALIKTSVISESFRAEYLSEPGDENAFEARAVVFEGPEDYHQRIESAELDIDERCLLVIRGCGPVGYPGSAEVVNMHPPAALLTRGITAIPTMGDGRQSGTSDSPSILNASPESAVGGNLWFIETGDRVRVDLNECRVDLLIEDGELEDRRKTKPLPDLTNQTPWQEFYRDHVGQLGSGGCLEFAVKYRNVCQEIPRHNH